MSEEQIQDQPQPCPLVTVYTTELGINPELLERLYALRKWNLDTDGAIPFKWPACLRTTKRSTGEEIRLREYQKVAAHHLARMSRMVLGDAVGLGKTISTIAAACYIRDRYPDVKIIVITTKSTTLQWHSEFREFSELRPLVMQDTFAKLKSYSARFAQLENFLSGDKADILICKYASLIGKRRKVDGKWDAAGNPISGGMERDAQEVKKFCQILKPHAGRIILILDEGHKFMHYNQTRKMVLNFSKYVSSVWALTATAIKNRLDEFYSIASAIGIRPLGYAGDFRENFCIMRDIYIGRGRRKSMIVGYKNIPVFKDALRPFFLGRSQKQVQEPLPLLTTVYHPVDLDEEQSDLLLNQIPSGEFQLPPKLVEVDGTLYEQERDPDNLFTMLSVYQLVANHPCLLDPSNTKEFYTKALSPKEEMLLDLLDGDLFGEKVVVFTKFRSHINRLEHLTKEGHFTDRKFLRITGAESEKKRNENKLLFQDPNSGYDLIFINEAGAEGINLQSAAHTVTLDLPWGWGSLLQLVGRMVRMASPHSACTLHVIIAKGTVDEYAVDTLKGKKGIFEAILGESHSAGILDDKSVFDLSSGMDAVAGDADFKSLLKAHVKKVSLKKFVGGAQLTKAVENKAYEMTFDRKPKEKKPGHDDFEELFRKFGGETVL